MSTLRSIRFRVTLLISVCILMVIAAYAAAAYQEMKSSAVIAAQDRLNSIAHDLATTLKASADRMAAEATTVAGLPALADYLRDTSSSPRPALEALGSRGGDSQLIGGELRDATGRRVLSTGSPPGQSSALDAEIIELARTADPTALVPFRSAGDSVLYGALGRVRMDSATVGYLVLWRRLATDSATLDFIGDLIGSDARVYLANTRGDVWTDLNRSVPVRRVDLSHLARGATYPHPDGGEVVAAGAVVTGSPWTLLVESPLVQVLAGPRTVIGEMAGFGLLLLVLGTLIAWIVGGRLTGSIVELADAAAAISAGDYSRRTPARSADEIGTLARAFNRMADSVEVAHRTLEQKVEQLAASETENRETRERLEYVIGASRAILYRCRVTDGDITLDWISENVRRELGYEVEETLRPGWWRSTLHPENDHAGIAPDHVPAGDHVTQEYRLRHADGEYRWIRDEQRVMRDETGQVREFVGVMSDITEHRRLDMAKEAAEAANRAKSDFLSRMSHELRTPLNAILGFGQILEMDVHTEENQESVEQILKAGQHLLALIDEVLDIARIEAGQMSLSVEPVSVRAVLQESVDLVRLTAAKQGITLRTKDALAVERFVRADQQRLKQVLLNLLSNAIKYNRPNGTVTLSCERAGEDRLRILVQDTGRGIPNEKLQRLFTPFDRLDAESAVEGTGLGLALSKGLVEAMGGRLGVESTAHVGSRFWVELSVAPRPAVLRSPPEKRRVEVPRLVAEPTHMVLFVEDNLANVRLMERIFERRPHVRLLTAMQGSLGLELAREHRPDLILLDLNLPDLSGEEVLRQLREDPALWGVPVVMISGDAIPSHVQRMLDRGAHGYITKPFDIQQILRVLDESLK